MTHLPDSHFEPTYATYARYAYISMPMADMDMWFPQHPLLPPQERRLRSREIFTFGFDKLIKAVTA